MSLQSLGPGFIPVEGADKISICHKLKFFLHNVTVEPIVFFFLIAGLMAIFTNQNLALEKSCRVNLQFNNTICDAITSRNKSGYEKYHETEIQALVQKFEAYKSLFLGSVPVVLMVFLGTWSDRNKRRKPLIIIPLIGACISNLLLLLNSIYFKELKMQYAWMSDVIPNSISGSFVVFLLGVYSYVGGIGDIESKTIRIGMISMTQTLAMSVGTFLAGLVLHWIGFIGVYALISSVIFVSLLYCLFIVKEQEILTPEEEEDEKTDESLRDIFAAKHIKKLFKTCFRNDEVHRRKKMIILMSLLICSIGPVLGELPNIYLGVRLRFQWNEVDYSIFTSFQCIVHLIGNTFTLTVFIKYLKFRDVTLGIIATCSKITSVLIYAFAPTGMFFFVAALTEVFSSANLIAQRAMMAKIVQPHELGQSNSVFGICEGLTPLIFGPLYSMVYIKTLMFFPGAFYLASGFFSFIVMILYIWLYNLIKTTDKIKSKEHGQTEAEEGLLKKNLPGDVRRSLEKIKA
ncbi:hypothetical protein WA026_013451 [Henosepilachna vigintioctopunctata]|uniref:Proton-coupled folate transporter n=1 Tax=Henosepilachna vigintioctopunctata TaxID=420089 RepID=A0AAW1VCC5_9CUCU